MFEKSLVLVGKSGSGKTSTITVLMQKLMEHGYSSFYKKQHSASDFSVVLRSPKGSLLGITSRGDSAEMLRISFGIFERFQCQYVVCASHETKAMFDLIEDCCKETEYLYSLFSWRKTDALHQLQYQHLSDQMLGKITSW